MATDSESAVLAEFSAGRLTTPGIVRSSSGTRWDLPLNEADCAEKSSSFDGKFVQMTVQTKINPTTEMEFVTAFPDRVGVVFITVRIK